MQSIGLLRLAIIFLWICFNSYYKNGLMCIGFNWMTVTWLELIMFVVDYYWLCQITDYVWIDLCYTNKAELKLSDERWDTPWTGHQSITEPTRRQKRQPFILAITPMCRGLEIPLNLAYMLVELWQEAGVPRQNPQMYRKNMETPHTKATTKVQTRKPSYCEANMIRVPHSYAS